MNIDGETPQTIAAKASNSELLNMLASSPILKSPKKFYATPFVF